MRILQINSVCGVGSTGRIVDDLNSVIVDSGHEGFVGFGRKASVNTHSGNDIRIGNNFDVVGHFLTTRLLDRHGLGSYKATSAFLNKIDKLNPDIIHLHNIHGYYINIKLLFDFIKQRNIPIVWTLHDCWSFTGHCPHFVGINCDKWKTQCHNCPRYKGYPTSFFVDNSEYMYKLKKELFSGISDMTLVTPSEWLAVFVKQSFLKDYPVKIINNGIDLSIFKPSESGFRKKYDLIDKRILLGVAYAWGKSKGLDVFIKLAKSLPESYQIVLVGTDDNVDKTLPDNVISIHRTDNQEELAEIYTAADLFVNPTRQEVFGMVNVESLACGTPVVTFNTGGCPEIVDSTCGSVVDCDDFDTLYSEILRICDSGSFSSEVCVARAKMFDKNSCFSEYMELYNSLR